MCVYIYIHIHTYTHTYTYVYTRMYHTKGDVHPLRAHLRSQLNTL